MGWSRRTSVGIVLINRLASGKRGFLAFVIAPVGEIGRCGDADQPGDPLRNRPRHQQHQPPAHRRAHQHHRPGDLRFDQCHYVIAPAAQRAVGKRPVARAAARIVEQQAGPPGGTRMFEHCGGLAPGHVGHIAGQEYPGRPCAIALAKGDPVSAGPDVKANFAHTRVMGNLRLRCNLQVFCFAVREHCFADGSTVSHKGRILEAIACQ